MERGVRANHDANQQFMTRSVNSFSIKRSAAEGGIKTMQNAELITYNYGSGILHLSLFCIKKACPLLSTNTG